MNGDGITNYGVTPLRMTGKITLSALKQRSCCK